MWLTFYLPSSIYPLFIVIFWNNTVHVKEKHIKILNFNVLIKKTVL